MQEERRARVAWLASNILPYEKEVRGWLRRSFRSHADIDDVIQESYCRIWSAKADEAIAAPRAYFYQTVRSVLIDQQRRARIVSIEAVADVDTLAVPGDELSPERITAGRLEMERLHSVLATLPERARRVLEMRRIWGISQKEIARTLGVSEAIVENDVVRALRHVLKAYEEEDAESSLARPALPRQRSRGARVRERQ
jgi:RNA polymerase sigma-70 factor (ECF subfamily)